MDVTENTLVVLTPEENEILLDLLANDIALSGIESRPKNDRGRVKRELIDNICQQLLF